MDNFNSNFPPGTPDPYSNQPAPMPPKRSVVKWVICILVVIAAVLLAIAWKRHLISFTAKSKKPVQTVQLNPKFWVQNGTAYAEPPQKFPTDLPFPAGMHILFAKDTPPNSNEALQSGTQFYEFAYTTNKNMESSIQDYQTYLTAHGWKVSLNKIGANQTLSAQAQQQNMIINFMNKDNLTQVDINFTAYLQP